jgi:hypothetical protein
LTIAVAGERDRGDIYPNAPTGVPGLALQISYVPIPT